jgi:hypothetical protein
MGAGEPLGGVQDLLARAQKRQRDDARLPVTVTVAVLIYMTEVTVAFFVFLCFATAAAASSAARRCLR